jgi:hypothetical protein
MNQVVPHFFIQRMTASQKVVIPVKTGVQVFPKRLEILDSGFRRNDGKGAFSTFCEPIKNSHFHYYERMRIHRIFVDRLGNCTNNRKDRNEPRSEARYESGRFVERVEFGFSNKLMPTFALSLSLSLSLSITHPNG